MNKVKDRCHPTMFYLRTAHIGEVAVGIWPEEMERACAQANIFLL